MTTIHDHIRTVLNQLRRPRGMFHIEVTAAEKACLETALNHHIGAMLIRVGELTLAHGAASPIVQKASEAAAKAERLYDRLVVAQFKLVEVTR